ncbi:MAG TPA: pirin family protein [Dehalococcoidia bacterium]|nr:pirin family protein [Dehalococcoidia bacterium]
MPAPIVVRRDSEIYSAGGGWFQARWHFSFDQYYDPKNMGIGKLRVFNHDTLVPGAIWPMHPHRDVEGITYVVAGQFEHADSLGNGGVLLPGGVQRMTLGSGALHSERNHSRDEPVQFIQMWILPAVRGLSPSIEQRQFQLAERHNRLLRVLKSEGAEGEGVTVHQDASVYVSRLDPGVELKHVFGSGRGGYFYLIEGTLTLNGETLRAGDAAKITSAGQLALRAQAISELILVDTPL